SSRKNILLHAGVEGPCFFEVFLRKLLLCVGPGLPSHNHHVEPRPEILHYLRGLVAPHQPIHAAILTCKIIVETVGTTEYYFTHIITFREYNGILMRTCSAGLGVF